jgi:hypothetical protein
VGANNDIEELERLHAESTPGNWRACTCGKCMLVWATDEHGLLFERDEDMPFVGRPADAAFVAAAHNRFPGLLAELKAARRLLADFRDNYDCDEDAHTHGTQCRCCAAEAALKGIDTDA